MDRVFFSFSSAISKHWEAELATLKGNNAKLTAALLESTANVKQWKQQLAAYQEEAERLHKRVSSGLCPWDLWPAGFLDQRKFTCRFRTGHRWEICIGCQNIYALYYMWVYWLKKCFPHFNDNEEYTTFGTEKSDFKFLFCHLLAVWPLVSYSPLSD